MSGTNPESAIRCVIVNVGSAAACPSAVDGPNSTVLSLGTSVLQEMTALASVTSSTRTAVISGGEGGGASATSWGPSSALAETGG